ncbi:hypothetical protein [Sphingomonas sp. dw_22]|uniref:hypothetical protein n=1 Tax=Sphingomonas sp. dw_22 TaxID=2721175 RepID=UPI001BD4C9CF|nr:hypothetical protein [Sphingomonas sp. dw_22]
MELLLLLTALLASLTGASGDRTGRPVQGVAVVQAAQAAQAAVQPARRVTGIVAASLVHGIPALVRTHIAAAPISSLRLAFEQRRE